MYKALICRTGGQGRVWKPDMTKDCLNSEKNLSAPILLGTPVAATLSPPMAWSNPGNRRLVTGERYERGITVKILAVPSVR